MELPRFETFYQEYKTGSMYGKNGEQTKYLKDCISKIEQQIRNFVRIKRKDEKLIFTAISVSDIIVGDTFARTVLFTVQNKESE